MEENNNSFKKSRGLFRDRVMMHMDESGLTKKDWDVLYKARRTVWTSASVGGVLGGTGAYFLLRRRRMSPFLMVPLVCGGLMLGSQIGMGFGVRSSLKSFEELPDTDNLKKFAQNIKNDMLAYRGKVYDSSTSNIRSMTPEEKLSYEESLQKSHNYFQKHRDNFPWSKRGKGQDAFLKDEEQPKKTNEWGDPVEEEDKKIY